MDLVLYPAVSWGAGTMASAENAGATAEPIFEAQGRGAPIIDSEDESRGGRKAKRRVMGIGPLEEVKCPWKRALIGDDRERSFFHLVRSGPRRSHRSRRSPSLPSQDPACRSFSSVG